MVRAGEHYALKNGMQWDVCNVETASELAKPVGTQQRLKAALQKAEYGNAKVVLLYADEDVHSIADAISTYARRINARTIMLSRGQKRAFWMANDLPGLLLREHPDLDLVIISRHGHPPIAPTQDSPTNSLADHLKALALVGIATATSAFFENYLAPANIMLALLLAVLLSALMLGRRPAILAAIVGVLVFDLYFVPPRFTLEVDDSEYLLTLIGFILTSIIISALATQRRFNHFEAREREKDANLLYSLGKELAQAQEVSEVGVVLERHLVLDFGTDVCLYQPGSSNMLLVYPSPGQTPNAQEQSWADWCFRNNEPGGSSSSVLASSDPLFYPLSASDMVVGVLSFKPNQPQASVSLGKLRILSAVCTQAALALQRIQLTEQAKQLKLAQATEKLQNALLNSISHELRTPLVSITGALSLLDAETNREEKSQFTELVHHAFAEAQRLNQLVGNLLEMARLESGALKLRKRTTDISDLIGTAISQIETRAEGRHFSVRMSPDMPAPNLDFVLITHVLVNLLDNSLKYSQPDSEIEIEAESSASSIQIRVMDRGIGITPGEEAQIFEKFTRGTNTSDTKGTGLGLAICHGIVEAHGGSISAFARPEGGAIFVVKLPV